MISVDADVFLAGPSIVGADLYAGAGPAMRRLHADDDPDGAPKQIRYHRRVGSP